MDNHTHFNKKNIPSIFSNQISPIIKKPRIVMKVITYFLIDKVVCIIPYLGYSRQTSLGRDNERNSALLAPFICDMLESVGCDEVITINFLKKEIKGFFSPRIPCLNINVNDIIIPYILNKGLHDPVLVSNSARKQRVSTALSLLNTFDVFGQHFHFGIMNEISYGFENEKT